MLNNEKDAHEEIELLRKAVTSDRNTGNMFFNEFTPEEVKQSLMPTHELRRPLEELIATGEAVFEFIKRSELKKSTKSAFYQLEKQFEFYKSLLLLKR